MGDWILFLIFSGLFYVMMRYGCGAHIAHGKKINHNHPNKEKDIDPVCGMEVEVEQGYGKMHKGSLYRFCSRPCLDRFENEPEKYLQKSK